MSNMTDPRAEELQEIEDDRLANLEAAQNAWWAGTQNLNPSTWDIIKGGVAGAVSAAAWAGTIAYADHRLNHGNAWNEFLHGDMVNVIQPAHVPFNVALRRGRNKGG